VFDAFPYDEWGEEITAFWTFGPGGSTGTYILTVLGVLLMVSALVGFVVLENRKLAAQAALLRSAAGIAGSGTVPPGPGPSQPPLAGPTTDPGR
jgi:hypothetical protein